ncbi:MULTISPECIES: lytic murein transglycosylase [unclassified Methylobacterium]|jgi:lytic murein transglycosylase|uniref:lytic murein transglycosylase n=1 Tax=unclassified Methylobacterium TaxID=2615210 RepID=UPI00135399D7|nr:lytic murein transglycosylase [Methylobacterium sp. 2A]MWV22339.1 lytic murein transglycosylase [Methylobacterium sp. 2A]
MSSPIRLRLGIRAAGLACALAPTLAAAAPDASAPMPPPFEICRADLIAWAASQAVPQGLAEAQLGSLTPDPDVLAATTSQGEFVRPLWDYIEASITPARIEAGRAKLAEQTETFAAIEARYGVDRHILAAFWGVESNFGAVLDNPAIVKPVVRSLATLACGDPARAPYWRNELSAALQILAWNQAPLDRMPGGLTGSWAGATGHTQFMPSVYQRDAVDFDGDGKRDIWTSVPDALASTAHYLRAHGWKPGAGWGTEALLPEGFDAALADETTLRSLAAWRALGVRPARPAAFPDEAAEATLILPAGIRGPAFLLRPNFAVILRYNTALAYALTVALLSDRLRGDPGLVRDWPRGDRVLTGDERRDLQTRLIERGFATGGVDGKIGPKTRAALRAFQGSVGLPADGYADAALLERIRGAP